MEFYEILDQILALLQRHGRVTYVASSGNSNSMMLTSKI